MGTPILQTDVLLSIHTKTARNLVFRFSAINPLKVVAGDVKGEDLIVDVPLTAQCKFASSVREEFTDYEVGIPIDLVSNIAYEDKLTVTVQYGDPISDFADLGLKFEDWFEKVGEARAERHSRAVEALIAALKDEDPDVRKEAAKALGKITGKDFGEEAVKWQKW